VSFNSFATDKGAQLLLTFVDTSQRIQAATESSEIYHALLGHHLAERLRWAHKLHNGPLQDLQGINFALTALANEPEVTQNISSELSQIRVTVQQIARQLRDMQNELCPPTLATFGLAVAIRSYVQTLQKRHPALAIQLTLNEDGTRLAQAVRTALFYACQQALDNVVQHAAAQQVEVRLTLDDALVQLEVIDDGCGFDVPPDWITIVRKERLGLVSVIERAEAIKGICRIASTLGKGTTLCVIAPILSIA
jgi:signal transduction histidine kinase